MTVERLNSDKRESVSVFPENLRNFDPPFCCVMGMMVNSLVYRSSMRMMAVLVMLCVGPQMTMQQGDMSLANCGFNYRGNRQCGMNNGVQVTCAGSTTEAPTTTERPTTAHPTTTQQTTSLRATTLSHTTPGEQTTPGGQTTPRVVVTTAEDGVGGTTTRERVTPQLTTRESTPTSPVSTALDGGFDSRGESNTGMYIGLAVGCILFIVCSVGIVMWLLKRRKREKKDATPKTTSQLTADFKQHSVVYENTLGSGQLPVRDLGRTAPYSTDDSAEYTYCAVVDRGTPEGSVRYATGAVRQKVELGYVAPNPSMVKTPKHPVPSKQEPRGQASGEIASPPYLELDADKMRLDTDRKSGADSDDPYYSKLRPDSPEPASNHQAADGADYFTLEDGLADSEQYTTGVIGEEAIAKPNDRPKQPSDRCGGDDADDHYYSFAKPETTSSDPPEDDVYAYADAPIGGADMSPNYDYFMIGEGVMPWAPRCTNPERKVASNQQPRASTPMLLLPWRVTSRKVKPRDGWKIVSTVHKKCAAYEQLWPCIVQKITDTV